VRFGGARAQRRASFGHDCHWSKNSEERFNPNDRRSGLACELEQARRHEKTKDLGMSWVKSGTTAVLSVPSVVVPNERNYLLNPAHPDFSKIRFFAPKPFVFDRRLRQFTKIPQGSRFYRRRRIPVTVSSRGALQELGECGGQSDSAGRNGRSPALPSGV
jgi:hypothetical protein